jgi:hypothetical protein
MTLYNNARHLREATESILAQTFSDFVLVMLDDGSEDETASIAPEFETTQARVRYFRHPQRQGMVPTWREVFETALRVCPSAEYFAWVSDHDVWAPTWLATLVAELDAHPDAVLAYPLAPRIDDQGRVIGKTPRTFDTATLSSVTDRWRRFCWEGFGSGDMVYGLVRVAALRHAGVFRPVLNPDRLLIAELTLQGQIRQVPEPLWFRRQSGEASVARQRATLFAGDVPPGFGRPPALQHVRVLRREYANPQPPRPRVTAGMRALYLVSSAWRGFRKTDTSKSLGRGVDNVHFVKKVAKKVARVSVYYTLVTAHTVAGRLRRLGRRIVYHTAMLSYRLGLRTPRNHSRTP